MQRRDGDATWRGSRAWFVAVAVGAALRVGWWLVAHPGPVSDYRGYEAMAARLLDTGAYTRLGEPTAFRVPGYPVFLALGMLVSRSHRWLSLLNVGLSVAAIPLTWLVATRLRLSRPIPVTAAFVVAVMPTLVLWSPVLGSENLLVVLLLAGVSVALTPTGGGRSAVLAGSLFGLCVLVRPEALFYVLAVPAVLQIVTVDRRELVGRSLVVIAIAALTVVPWYVRNEVSVGSGAGLSTTGGMNFYMAHRDDGYGYVDLGETPLAGLGEVETNRRGYELGLERIRRQPWTLVARAARGTYELYRPPRYAAHYSTRARAEAPPYAPGVPVPVVETARTVAVRGWLLTAPLALGGLVALWRTRRALLAIAALLAANWVCFTVVAWAMPRYRFAIEPLLAVCAAAALVGVASLATSVAERARGAPTRLRR